MKFFEGGSLYVCLSGVTVNRYRYVWWMSRYGESINSIHPLSKKWSWRYQVKNDNKPPTTRRVHLLCFCVQPKRTHFVCINRGLELQNFFLKFCRQRYPQRYIRYDLVPWFWQVLLKWTSYHEFVHLNFWHTKWNLLTRSDKVDVKV